MKRIPFTKYQALGNDYIVIDPDLAAFTPTPANIRLLCDRNMGVGSDGILYGPIDKSGSPDLRVFNPDGGEAERSGNGACIFARYLADERGARGKISFMMPGGPVTVHLLSTGIARVDMGVPSFSSKDIPVTGDDREVLKETLVIDGSRLCVSCVSIGNPHCVIVKNDVSKELALKFGPGVENFKPFSKRINVEFVKVVNRRTLQLEIWERGVGYTLASGSAACAAVAVTRKLGLIDDGAAVKMPGGTTEVSIGKDGDLTMSARVSSVCRGELTADLVGQFS